MAIYLKPATDPAAVWIEFLKARDPSIDIRVDPDVGDPGDIEFALCVRPPPGLLASFPNLRFIGSIPAGVDHLFRDPELPRHVPIVRCINPYRPIEMAEFVLYHVLRFHRRAAEYETIVAEGVWRKLPQPKASDRRIGVMGVGEIGAGCAKRLAMLGFTVAGWSRSPKAIEGVESFHGADQLDAFLARTDCVVNLLALTDETRDILDARAFARMPKGGYVINVGRGEHLVDEDLMAALDSGHLSGASIDVFRKEPYTADHPFLHHPKIYATPHIACMGRVEFMIDGVLENMRRARAGEELLHRVDLDAGY